MLSPSFSRGQAAAAPISQNRTPNTANNAKSPQSNASPSVSATPTASAKSPSSPSVPKLVSPAAKKLTFSPVDSSAAAPGEVENVRLWNEIEISIKCSNLPPFEPELPPTNSLVAVYTLPYTVTDPSGGIPEPEFIGQTEVVQCDSSPEYIHRFLLPYEIASESSPHLPFHPVHLLFQVHQVSPHSHSFDFATPIAFAIVELAELTQNANPASYDPKSPRFQLLFPLTHFTAEIADSLTQQNSQLLVEANFSFRFHTTAQLSMYEEVTQFPTLKLATTAQDRRVPVPVGDSAGALNLASSASQEDELQQCVLRVQLADIHTEKDISPNSSAMIAVFVRSSVHADFSFIGRTEIRRGEAHPMFKKSFLVDFPKNKQWSIMFAVYDIPINKESATEEDRLGAVICSLDHLANYPCQKLVYAIEHLTVRQELKRLPNARLIVELIPLDMFFSWQQEAATKGSAPPPPLPSAALSPVPAAAQPAAPAAAPALEPYEAPKSPAGLPIAPPAGLMRARPSLSLHVLPSNTAEMIINQKEPTEADKKRERRRSSITTIPKDGPASPSSSAQAPLSPIPQSPTSPTSSTLSPGLSSLDSADEDFFAQRRGRSATTAPSSNPNQHFSNRNPKLEAALKEEEQLNVKLNAWRQHHLDQYRALMMTGSVMKKYQFTGNGIDKRSVCFDWNLNAKKYPAGAIYWCDPGKKPSKSTKCLPIVSITAIYAGRLSPVLQKKSARSAIDAHCFSLLSKDRSMDFECESEYVRNAWVLAVKEAVLRANVSVQIACSTGDFPAIPDPPTELQERLKEIERTKERYKPQKNPFANFTFARGTGNVPNSSISTAQAPSSPQGSVIAGSGASPSSSLLGPSSPGGSVSGPGSASGSLKSLKKPAAQPAQPTQPTFTPTVTKVEAMPLPQTRAHSNTVVGRGGKSPIFSWDSPGRSSAQLSGSSGSSFTWDRKSGCLVSFTISARSLFLIHSNRPSITLELDPASPEAAAIKPPQSHFMVGLFHRLESAAANDPNAKYTFLGHTEDQPSTTLSPSFTKPLVMQWAGGSPEEPFEASKVQIKLAVYESADEGVRASDQLGFVLISLAEAVKAAASGSSAPMVLDLTHESPVLQEKIKATSPKLQLIVSLSPLKGAVQKGSSVRDLISNLTPESGRKSELTASPPSKMEVTTVSPNELQLGRSRTASMGSRLDPIKPVKSNFQPTFNAGSPGSSSVFAGAKGAVAPARLSNLLSEDEPIGKVVSLGAAAGPSRPSSQVRQPPSPGFESLQRDKGSTILEEDSDFDDDEDLDEIGEPQSGSIKKGGRSNSVSETGFPSSVSMNRLLNSFVTSGGEKAAPVKLNNEINLSPVLAPYSPNSTSSSPSSSLSQPAPPAVVNRVEITIAGSSFPSVIELSSSAFGLIGAGPVTGDANYFPLHSLSGVVDIDFTEEFSMDTSMDIEYESKSKSNVLLRIWQFPSKTSAESARQELVNKGKLPSNESLLGQIQVDLDAVVSANGDLVDYEIRNPFNARMQKMLQKKGAIVDVQFVKQSKGKAFRLPNQSPAPSPPGPTPASPASPAAASSAPASSSVQIVPPSKYLATLGVTGSEIPTTLQVLRPALGQGQIFSARCMWPEAKSKPGNFERFIVKAHGNDAKLGFCFYWNAAAHPNAAPLALPLRQLSDLFIGRHRSALSFAAAPPNNADSLCFAIGGKVSPGGALVSLAFIAESAEIRDLWILALLAEAETQKIPVRVHMPSKDGPAPAVAAPAMQVSSPKAIQPSPKKGKK